MRAQMRAARAVQARENGAADVAGQVAAGVGDALLGGDQVLGGLDGGLVARPVPGTASLSP